jgi:hypothetical protein
MRLSGSGGGRKSATGGLAGKSRQDRRGGSTGTGVVSASDTGAFTGMAVLHGESWGRR